MRFETMQFSRLRQLASISMMVRFRGFFTQVEVSEPLGDLQSAASPLVEALRGVCTLSDDASW
jgi:hypothetical protein